MIFRLALKNIIFKPMRAISTAFAIAVAVAMIFTVLSFKSSVYDRIFAVETAASGESDILISTNSSSDRIMQVGEPLKSVDGITKVTPSLSLYATANVDGREEYVRARGFEKGHIEDLRKIDIISMREGLTSLADMKEDDIVISRSAAEHFGLDTQSSLTLSLGPNTWIFYVAAIARDSGYFLDDAPYLILGHIADGVGRLLWQSVGFGDICNEIYVTVAEDADVDKVIKDISSMSPYDEMLISRTGDNGYIAEQVNSLTAPVVLAGAAVLVLSVAIIVLLFMMSEQDKVSLVGRLRIVGATKGQLIGIFLLESVILAAVGVALGAGIAVGVYTLILKLTLSMFVNVAISPLYLALALLIGFATAAASSLLPIFGALKGTIRSTQTGAVAKGRGKKTAIMLVALLAINVLLTALLYADGVGSATDKAVIAVISLVFLLLFVAAVAAPAMRAVMRLAGKANALRVASADAVRVPRHSRAATLLATGMTVSMLLFMAWSVTTSIFTSYISDFEDMIFVNNIREGQDIGEFEELDGVKLAAKIVWRQGELTDGDLLKTVNVLGSKEALSLADFEYITDKDIVNERLSSGEPYIFLDLAVKELYGIDEGDEVELKLDDAVRKLKVGGILHHRLFNGSYAVVSEDALDKLYGVKVDTVVILADGDADAIADSLRQHFAQNNLYVIKTLDAYKWDMMSMQSVFDLVGTLAAVVAAFILIVAVAATVVGRTSEDSARTALLNAGMSKRTLLFTELAEHSFVALTSFAVALVMSIPLTSALIVALRLFGLYFEFMYEAWVTVATGAAMCLIFGLVPIVGNFKKGYALKRR